MHMMLGTVWDTGILCPSEGRIGKSAGCARDIAAERPRSARKERQKGRGNQAVLCCQRISRWHGNCTVVERTDTEGNRSHADRHP